MQQGHSNDFQTPPWVLEPLYPYLDKNKTVWECACGRGNLVNAFTEAGQKVIGTDILTGTDFWTADPEEYNASYIITNPPYSKKNTFILRCYAIGLPFALLLPLTALESQERQSHYRTYGLELILLPRRVNFETPTGKGTGSWFATAWFTNGLNIGKELTFWDVSK